MFFPASLCSVSSWEILTLINWRQPTVYWVRYSLCSSSSLSSLSSSTCSWPLSMTHIQKSNQIWPIRRMSLRLLTTSRRWEVIFISCRTMWNRQKVLQKIHVMMAQVSEIKSFSLLGSKCNIIFSTSHFCVEYVLTIFPFFQGLNIIMQLLTCSHL